MSEQKRHLTITSIIVTLALAVLCYGSQAMGTGPDLASHKGRSEYSQKDRGGSEQGHAPFREAAAGGGVAFNKRGGFGGQLG